MKTILITGGKGFIGKHLIQKLSGKYNIISIDNEYRECKKIQTPKNQDITYIKENITNNSILEENIQKADIIVHLAAISQVMTSIENPKQCYEWNTEATKNIVELVHKYKKRIVFSSSREVYGTVENLPAKIESPIKPENPYGASKIMGEAWIRAYTNTFNLNACILRLSNVYGYGDANRVIPIFVEKLKDGKDISIYGDNKIIDFVYIDDVVEMFYKTIENPEIQGIYNVGTGKQTTLPEIAEIIIEKTESTAKAETLKNRQGEVDRFTADITETTKVFGWKPQYTLNQGIEEMLQKYE